MKKNYKLKTLRALIAGRARKIGLSVFLLAGINITTVYSQTTYSFTTAGLVGRVGPNQTQLNTAYLTTNLNGSVTSVSGIQEFTVPVTGLYSIDAAGAVGGNSISNFKIGGLGARIKGEFNLTAGQVLRIIVGQTAAGTYAAINQFQAGGGGGGSFVWLSTSTVPLVVAGGGGGGGAQQGTSFNGVGGTIVTAGTASSGSFVSVGGTLGNGGGENSGNGEHSHGGSAGGGWLTDGASVISAAAGGSNILYNNGLGGFNGSFGGQNYGSDGGFGGGGGGVIGGGGGGGYSGGGAGSQPTGWYENGGGGGGSFNSGANQVNTGSVVTGSGFVFITALCTPGTPPTNTTSASNQSICANNSTTLSVVGTGTLNWYATPSSTTSLASGSVYATTTLSPGSYTYYAASTNTCSEGARTPITVLVNSTPTIAITGGTAIVCGGTPINLSASGADTYTWSTSATTSTIAPTPTVNSSYTVTGTTSLTGCSSNAVVSVTVTPAPVLAITGAGTICTGSGLSKVLTVSGADTYTWSTASNSNSITVTPVVTTTYTANGTSSVTGCTSTITAVVVVTSCTSLNHDSAELSGLTLYPNPNNGEFTIELNSDAQISIVNILGEEIVKENMNSGKLKLNMSNKPNGVYFVKISSKNQQQTIKLIKE